MRCAGSMAGAAAVSAAEAHDARVTVGSSARGTAGGLRGRVVAIGRRDVRLGSGIPARAGCSPADAAVQVRVRLRGSVIARLGVVRGGNQDPRAVVLPAALLRTSRVTAERGPDP